jgi:hypothetical protein
MMTTYKSSSLNLYDSNGVLYTTSAFPDRVEHNSGTKSQHLLATTIAIYNNDGKYTNDAVKDLKDLDAGLVSGRAYTDQIMATEAACRLAIDNTLNAKITLENTNRAAADAVLQAIIASDKVAADAMIAAETTARTTADQEMKTCIEAEATARAAAVASARASLDAEIARAVAAEQKEASDRAAADVILRADLTAEATRAVAAEQKEAADRAAADTTIVDNLNKETTDCAADVAIERGRLETLLEGTSVNLDQLKELVTNYNTFDVTQQSAIGVVTATCTSLQIQITDVKTKLDCALISGVVEDSDDLHSASSAVTAIAADQAFPVSLNNSWYFINDPTVPRNKKINWYFMGNQDETQTKLVSDLTTASFTIKVLSNGSLPFITVYSKRDTTTGAVNAASWYQARKVYIVASNPSIVVGNVYTFYIGTVPTFYSGTLVQLVEDPVSSTSTAAATGFAGKQLLTMSVGTDSSVSVAGKVKFEMSAFRSKFGTDVLSYRLL